VDLGTVYAECDVVAEIKEAARYKHRSNRYLPENTIVVNVYSSSSHTYAIEVN
jgi:hypothetical protein